jgi:EAL domain-containing protein (putative c-di-GMP-specific phosphodiesterase class I)
VRLFLEIETCRFKEKRFRGSAIPSGSAVSYSSLGYLGRFPVDRVKIAQSFIVNLTGETSNMAIVKAAIGLAREPNLDVLVEGIETAEQLGRIRSWGCRNVQGDYFSKSLPASELSTLLLADTHAHAANTASPREAA